MRLGPGPVLRNQGKIPQVPLTRRTGERLSRYGRAALSTPSNRRQPRERRILHTRDLSTSEAEKEEDLSMKPGSEFSIQKSSDMMVKISGKKHGTAGICG